MNCSLISVGTELLFGQITNTNTVYLSQKLNVLGMNVLYHYTVGDNPARLKDIMKFALEKSDIIITTGGLGPTQDDLTKEIAAEALEDPLVLHQPSYERLESFFKRINKKMTDNNIKQAYLPQNAEVFQNDVGTAPGFALSKKGKIIICLPGPPGEMKHMFEKYTDKYLRKKSSHIIHSKMLRFFGIGESALETELLDLITEQIDPTLATYAKEGEVSLRITSKRESMKEAEDAVDEMVEKIKSRLEGYIYSYQDEELIEVVAKKMIKHHISISTAESCTGGLLASKLTDISGISSVFDRCIVSYSNDSKIEELGVKPETLDFYGAVSRETAIEMVKGIKKVSGSRLCLAVTGIAGPGGGTEEKPVGLVYIAMAFDDEISCKKFNLRRSGRSWNRNYTVLLMLDMINKALDKKLINRQLSHL